MDCAEGSGEGMSNRAIAILTPSRGLVHSRTVEAVLANTRSMPLWDWHFTHDLPIPDCDERLAEVGMASNADLLWYIEEDVIPPADALERSIALLDEGWDVAAVDYPVGSAESGWGCLVRDAKGEIEWCGLGCTLIRREVFEKLPRPWFSTDYQYIDFHHGAGWEKKLGPQDNARRFGQQDIYFCMALRAAGMRIGQVPGMVAGHALLERLGAQGTNVGMHQISIRQRIKHQYPGPVAS
jgi:hypothetical protein